MIRNPQEPRAQATYVGGLHGSSLWTQGRGLDAERAASMADEGGASGAIVDAQEQELAGEHGTALARPRAAWTQRTWLPWLLATGGLAAAIAFWLRRR